MKLRTTALAVLPLSLLLASCGGSSDSESAEPGVSPSSPQKVQVTDRPGPQVTTSGKPGGQPPATSAPGGATAAPGRSGSTAAPGARAATHTAPGRYTYDTKGNVTAGGQTHDASGSQVLKVDRPVGQRQRSSLGGERGGGTEQDVLHQADGTYLARLKISASGFEKEFRPAKPVLGVPKPATAGRSWTWTMTSTDGKTRAAYSGKLTRKETVTIGGTKVDTWLIESTLKLSGDIDYTDRRKTNYDEGRLLQVRTHSIASGTFSGIPFTSDTKSTLRSVKPS